MPSWGVGWSSFSHPGASVLHMCIGTHVLGILVPAVLLKQYHAVTNASSDLFIEPTGEANTLRSVSLFRV